MREKFKFIPSFLLITLVMAFPGSGPGHAKAGEASSPTADPKLEEPAAGIKAEYEAFARKFEDKPPLSAEIRPSCEPVMDRAGKDNDGVAVSKTAPSLGYTKA